MLVQLLVLPAASLRVPVIRRALVQLACVLLRCQSVAVVTLLLAVLVLTLMKSTAVFFVLVHASPQEISSAMALWVSASQGQ